MKLCNTDNLIIVRYPRWAGGKFLINCLGLSNGAVLQDAGLAKKDINGQLSIQDKFNILVERVHNTPASKWYDLMMGCQNLFGFSEMDISADLSLDQLHINPVIFNLINTDRKFFIVCHNQSRYQVMKKLFPLAKTIVFKNAKKFVQTRSESPEIHMHWNHIKETHWPSVPPKLVQDFNFLPDLIKQDLVKHFPDFIDKLIDSTDYEEFDEVTTFNWDTNWYFSADTTVNQLQNLYFYFGLSDFDQNLITNFYNLWRDKISQHKKITLE